MANNFDDDDIELHNNAPDSTNKLKVVGNTLKNNPKFRNVMIISFILIISTIVISFMRGNYFANKKSGKNANIQVYGPNTITSLPGTSTSDSYNKLQDEENELKAQQAKDTGGSYLSIPTNNIETSIKDPFEDITEEYKPKVIKEEVVKPMEDIKVPDIQMPETQQVIEQTQPEPVVYQEQEYKDVSRADNNNDAMLEQFNMYIAKWSPNKSYQEKTVDASFTAMANQSKQNDNGYSKEDVSYSNSNRKNDNSKGASFIKAGTVIPAELITAINSDEPGPVMARVSTGPLKGASLIGEITHSNQAVVLRFSRITMEDQDRSFNINAFAVDTSTYRTFLASDVDNHYFLRYGLRLAAAFVEGYGDAIASSGATTTTSPFGSTTSVLGDYSHSQIMKMSAGKLGQQLGREIDASTNGIKPTVTVDGGLPIGVLFVADF